ncbi:signal recognition particle protein [Demequina capsici]|uniref:Signal recognition particle protein n=1 Tax=Demequina capsici TaxID=3075620 RepID=A0AA96J6J1_9MICO|nr:MULTISPECIES: signal recognition particle protein [unclassified Demequina]WNM23445.1 signal recognition particle protein [Demequina sp. OYTSA14]WNM26322.1 signal recognition particle protein [Demequina sp. PMTSA13]
MFANLSDRLTETFKSLRGKGRLSEADIDGTIREIRRALLDADVAVPVVRSFTAAIRERALGAEVSGALNPGQQVVKIVHEELITVLGGEQRPLRLAKHGPTVIMLAGLQGAGKTTFAGKLAAHLKAQGQTPLLVAADLQRPNAVTQLKVVGERAGVPVFAPEAGVTREDERARGNPVKVAKKGLKEAQDKQHTVVIVDTAGRLGVDAELMRQAADIRKAVEPDEVLFVIDAMIGQDAVATAQAFQEGVDFTGVVLSKLDGDARGGAALSVAQVTGRPIMFASVGEKLEDIEVFHPDRMASRILDMGDILTLIEQAEQKFDQAEAERMAVKMQRGEDFTFTDFLSQMQQLKNMGSMKKMLGMLPGMGAMRDQIDNIDERELVRTEAIIQSMTPLERDNPKVLNGSRRARIATGSGMTVADVNSLVKRFEDAQRMMKAMAKGGGLPGMGAGPGGFAGLPGGKKSKGKQAPQRKVKGKSGNPAKRAQQEQAARSRSAGEQPAAPAGSAFGLGAAPQQDLDPTQIPSDLSKYLRR